jgi:hypothetical protein
MIKRPNLRIHGVGAEIKKNNKGIENLFNEIFIENLFNEIRKFPKFCETYGHSQTGDI